MDALFLKMANEFKGYKNIAVAGFSASGANPGNHIYEKFRKNGYNVYALHPKLEIANNVKCYPNLSAIPAAIEGVVITAPPASALAIVKDCKEKGVKSVWMHRSFGNGSYSQEAVEFCRENGINCILGGCPLMFIEADPGHRMFKHVFNWLGKLKAEENVGA